MPVAPVGSSSTKLRLGSLLGGAIALRSMGSGVSCGAFVEERRRERERGGERRRGEGCGSWFELVGMGFGQLVGRSVGPTLLRRFGCLRL
jgi:hypothetical protein